MTLDWSRGEAAIYPNRPGRSHRAGRRAPAALAAVLLLVGMASPAGAARAPDSLVLSSTDRRVLIEALSGDPAFDGASPEVMSDVELWAALLRHANLELGQRLRPDAVDPLWALAPPPRPVAAEAQAARESGRLRTWVAGLAPSDRRYRVLLGLRRRYRSIVQAGGWAAAPAAAAGHASPAWARAALRARLAAEGYLPPAAGKGGAVDLDLKAALSAFQSQHALAADGAVGAKTLAALNVSAEARLAQIDANLERWRWLPRLPPDRVEVDIGGADATLFTQDSPQLTMRVIVGDPAHKTPLFASRLESVVFNPPWNVPSSIAANELLPHEQADPGYLARSGFVTVDGGGLQQRPGPQNALGQLKFDFPSPFGVYLHDTPARAAFGQPNRWRSHGCVRLENPQGLAAAVLGPQGWAVEKIAAAIEAKTTSRVALARPVPLYVLYWTVEAAADGTPLFRPDPYGWDDKLLRALARGVPGDGTTTQVDGGCRDPGGGSKGLNKLSDEARRPRG